MKIAKTLAVCSAKAVAPEPPKKVEIRYTLAEAIELYGLMAIEKHANKIKRVKELAADVLIGLAMFGGVFLLLQVRI